MISLLTYIVFILLGVGVINLWFGLGFTSFQLSEVDVESQTNDSG